MKVQRQIKEPNFFEWLKHHLPPSLSAGRCSEGYGCSYYVYAGKAPLFFRGDPIAEIEGATICLYHTNYYSDMEDVARRYEQETGYEVTLKYWQAPKDSPVA